MRLVSLEEERIPQLGRRRFGEVPAAVVAARLATGTFIGSGSFCRVWKVASWHYANSPANGRPVVIKVCSAGFKELTEDARRSKQHALVRHWQREVNAHLLLEDEPRVVRAFHTFRGTMIVPCVTGMYPQAAAEMRVVGIVEELCSETSLQSFVCGLRASPALRATLWPLRWLASEFSALTKQVARMQEMGIVHQDIKGDNLLVHLPEGPGSMPVLKLGDLNGAQWEELTRDGHHWIGTIGFMPRRVRALYFGLQAAAKGVGELNYDTYQLGRLLLRQLLEYNGTSISYPRRDEDLEAEEVEVKSAALALLTVAPPPNLIGVPEKELWTFGVLIALLMSWDEPYTGPADQLRLAPADAAAALADWAALCAARQAAPTADAFWRDAGSVDSMAALYLRLAELARLPPLDEPHIPGVHVQNDEFIQVAVENFWHYGSSNVQLLAGVQARAAEILAERKAAAAEAAAAAAAAQRAAQGAAAGRQGKEKPSLRSTAWESKVSRRAQEEEAFLDGGTTEEAPGRKQRKRRFGENAAANRETNKRQVALVAAPAKKGRLAAPAPAPAVEKARLGAEAQQAGALLVLSSKLCLKDIWGEGHKEADGGPLLLGPKHEVAQMLADTVRGAAGAAGQEVHLELPGAGGATHLTFALTARRGVQFSKAQMAALAGDAAACALWNAFVGDALAAWRREGKEGSLGRRLRLLEPLQA